MSATKSVRVKSLLVDTDRNGTAETLDENGLLGLAKFRTWGPFTVNLAATGTTLLMTVPAGRVMVLTGAIVVQTGSGEIATAAEIEIGGTGSFSPELKSFRKEFSSGIALLAGGASVSCVVSTAQTGTISGSSSIILEGYLT
jgi:hypothetical protein